MPDVSAELGSLSKAAVVLTFFAFVAITLA